MAILRDIRVQRVIDLDALAHIRFGIAEGSSAWRIGMFSGNNLAIYNTTSSLSSTFGTAALTFASSTLAATFGGTQVTIGGNAATNALLLLNSTASTTQGVICYQAGTEVGGLRFSNSTSLQLTVGASATAALTITPALAATFAGAVTITQAGTTLSLSGSGYASTQSLSITNTAGTDSCFFGMSGTAYSGSLAWLGNNQTFIYAPASPGLRIGVGTGATAYTHFAAGTVTIAPTTASTSTTTGALVVSGGVGIAGAFYAGGAATANGFVSTSTNALQGAVASLGIFNSQASGTVTLQANGGSFRVSRFTDNTTLFSVTDGAVTTSVTTVASTVASTSTTTGALVVSGGAGIAGNLFVHSTTGLAVGNGAVSATSWLTSNANQTILWGNQYNDGTARASASSRYAGKLEYTNTTGIWVIGGTSTTQTAGSAIANDANTVTINPVTTTSTSTTTGALVVSGGVGISGALYVGGNQTITGAASASLSFAKTNATAQTFTLTGGDNFTLGNITSGTTPITVTGSNDNVTLNGDLTVSGGDISLVNSNTKIIRGDATGRVEILSVAALADFNIRSPDLDYNSSLGLFQDEGGTRTYGFYFKVASTTSEFSFVRRTNNSDFTVMTVANTANDVTFTGDITVSGGNMGVGAASVASQGIYIGSTGLTGTLQVGVASQPTFTSGATTGLIGFYSNIRTVASVFTSVEGTGLYADSPTLGAGSIVTSMRGIYVANQGGDTDIAHAIGIEIAAQSGAATTNIGLRNAGTTQLTGNVGIGGVSGTDRAVNITSSALSSTTQYGIVSLPTFNSSALTSGYSGYFGVITSAAFTMIDGFGIAIAPPTIGSGSVTNMRGLYIANQGVSGKTTTAIGVDIEAQSGAATTNVGLRNQGTTILSRTNISGTTVRTDSLLTISGNAASHLTGSTQYGFLSEPTFGSAVTTAGYAAYIASVTAASAFTMTTSVAVLVGSPTVGSGSSITTQRGVHVINQGASGIANAYGIDIDAQSGASTTNVGLRNSSITLLNTTGTTVGNGGTYTLQVQYSGTTHFTAGSDNTNVYLQSWSSKPLHINNQGNNVVFFTNSAGSVLTVASTTASTSSTTGALVVSGGVGIAGALNAGTTSVLREHALTGGDLGSGTTILQLKNYNGTTRFNFRGDGVLVASAGVASTSNTTGTIIVTGGVGISGTLAVGGGKIQNTSTQSTTYTLVTTDYFIAYTGTGGHTLTLPSTPITGQTYVIKNKGSGSAITISGNGTTIWTTSGVASFTMAVGDFCTLIYDGATWNKV